MFVFIPLEVLAEMTGRLLDSSTLEEKVEEMILFTSHGVSG